MEQEIRELEKRAFQSWETEFTRNLMIKNKLIRVGCATFTMARTKNLKPNTFNHIMDDYFHSVAKRQGRHLVWVYGMSNESDQVRTHQHGDIYVFYKEGPIKDIETYRWLLEARFKHGRCLIEGKKKILNKETNLFQNKGNWTGYSLAKHDGNSDLIRVYCPKIGECGKKTKRKGDRRSCVYQRSPIKL